MFVEAQGLSKAFGRQRVLQEIGLSIAEREIFGLLGPSGSGKTTLIRMITGALPADQGTVRIGDYRVPGFDALRIIGYMPQSDALYGDLSGYDNLAFFGALYGLGGKALRRRIPETLALVGLADDARKLVGHYSGGMCKRLSLAAALLHAPRLLVLDEPTVGIDPLLRRRIWDEFYRLKAQGATLIVTTHVMDEAVRCDRLGLLYGGRMIACGTVADLLAQGGGSLEELFFRQGGENA